MVARARSKFTNDLNPVVEEEKEEYGINVFDSHADDDEKEQKEEEVGDSMRKLIPNDPIILSPPETGRV